MFKPAFTLIELLVVISIIAILLAVATVSYTNAQQKGRDNKRKSDLKAVQQALELYFQQNGKYPEQHTGGLIRCASAGSGINWGSGSFTCATQTYMDPLPRDPVQTTTTQYYYYSNNSGTPTNATYKLFAKLENQNDKDLIYAPSACSSNTPGVTWATSGFYYCVINP